MQKVPYMIIVGEKEQQLDAITIRKRKQGGNKNFQEVLENFKRVDEFLEMIAADRKFV